MIKKNFLGAGLLFALMTMGASAHAITTTYLFEGSVINCPDVGLNVCGNSLNRGDTVGGTLDILTAAIVPGGQIGSGDITDYSFAFGSDIVFNTANSMITQSFILVDGAGDLDGGALVLSALMVIPGTSGQKLTLNFGASWWDITATVNGTDVVVAAGIAKLTEVPVPGALLMFAPALLGFLGLRRRKAA